METRLVIKNDASVLARLHAESFGAARWSLSQVEASLALDTTEGFVAEEAALPLGFIFCQLVGEEAEILTFCVAPASRRKGVGRVLLAAAVKGVERKGARRLFLEVAADNAAALSLYEKAGFRVVGRRVDYYKSLVGFVDAVMMSVEF